MFRIDRQSVHLSDRPFALPQAVQFPVFEDVAAAKGAANKGAANKPAAQGAAAHSVEAAQAAQRPAQEVEPEPPLPTEQELFEEAKAQADAMVHTARVECAKMREEGAKALAEVQLQVEDIRQAAYEAGHEQGLAEGGVAGAKAYEETIAQGRVQIATALSRVDEARQRALSEAEKACVQLSLSVAEKVLGAAMQFDENTFLYLIQAGLDTIKHDGSVMLRVSPQEYQLFFADDPQGLSTEMLKVRAVQDAQLDTGDLVLTSDAEVVDAGLKSQISWARTALEEAGGKE